MNQIAEAKMWFIYGTAHAAKNTYENQNIHFTFDEITRNRIKFIDYNKYLKNIISNEISTEAPYICFVINVIGKGRSPTIPGCLQTGLFSLFIRQFWFQIRKGSIICTR